MGGGSSNGDTLNVVNGQSADAALNGSGNQDMNEENDYESGEDDDESSYMGNSAMLDQTQHLGIGVPTHGPLR